MVEVVFADLCSFQVDHNGKQAYYVLRNVGLIISCALLSFNFFVGCPFDRGVNSVFWFSYKILVYVWQGFGNNEVECVLLYVQHVYTMKVLCQNLFVAG